MSSSESEDDFYGNAAHRLERLKKKLPNNNLELNNEPSNKKSSKDQKTKKQPVTKADDSFISLNDSFVALNDSEEITLDSIIAKHGNINEAKKTVTRRGRTTRNSTKTNLYQSTEIDAPSAPTEESSRGRRGKKKTSTTPKNSGGRDSNSTVTPPRRARNRTPRRGRGRGRSRNSNVIASDIPTFSIGNTHEYPDMSDNVQLFSAKPQEVVTIDDDFEEENEELSVKVYWQSSEIYKFTIRKYQKLKLIFDYFSSGKNITSDKLFFTYNDVVVNVDDTPDSIDYSIAKFIEGGIVNENLKKTINKVNKTNGITLKFQFQNVKKPFEIPSGLDEKMIIAMTKCAEHFEKPIDNLKFYFDGDLISGKSTPKELELEGGECIDVKVIR